MSAQKRRALLQVENWEDQLPTAHERALDRYPVSLRLHYKATSKLGPVQGFAQTRMMSSKDIVFAQADGLEAGMKAEIVLAWPFV